MPDDQPDNAHDDSSKERAKMGSSSDPHPVIARRSLTRRALVMMGLRIALVLVVITVLSYLHVYGTARQAALDAQWRTVDQQGRLESEPFLSAEQRTALVRDEFLRRLAMLGDRDPTAELERLSISVADGTIRVRPELIDHQHRAIAVLRPGTVATPDLHRRLLVGLQLLDQWGPVLATPVCNSFIELPEAVITFCPDQDLRPNTYRSLIAPLIAAPQVLPTSPQWTTVRYDEATKDWLVSCLTPGIADGRLAMAAGQDVRIAEAIRRTTIGSLSELQDGTWNLIVDAERRLIAHPQLALRIAAANGALPLTALADPALSSLVDSAATAVPTSGSAVIEAPQAGAILGITRLQGPGWLFISVHPTSLLSGNAFATARMVLLLGGGSLIIELGILAFILRRHIADPIASFVSATDRVSRGDFTVRLDHQREDELGQLARSINRMTKAVGERDAALIRQFDQLEQARRIAEHANLAKAEFLGTMSHELRTPLNGVIGMTELLINTPLNPLQREYAETISISGRSLLGIIDDILDFTRLNAGKLRLDPRPTNLGQVIAETDSMMRTQAEAKGLTLIIRVHEGFPSRVYADPARVRQVLVNLLSNATKFTDEGGVSVTLACVSMVDGKAEIRLTVEDTGPGIAPEHLPLLGERFRQIDGSFARRHGGTGLGLAITKSLLALMDGDLLINSTLDEGSSFTAVMRLRLST